MAIPLELILSNVTQHLPKINTVLWFYNKYYIFPIKLVATKKKINAASDMKGLMRLQSLDCLLYYNHS